MIRNKSVQFGVAVLFGAALLFYFMVYVPKSTYVTLTPYRGTLDKTVFGIGYVDAKSVVAVSSQTGGTLVLLSKEQGNRVKKGELIAKVDPVDLPDLLAQSRAALRKAEFETAAAEKEYESLRAQLDLAKSTHERYARLHQKGYVAKAELDKAAAERASLAALAEAARTRVDAGRAEQEYSRKSIDALGQKLSRFSIHAPIDGRVISTEAEQGQTLLPSQGIVTLVDPETVWVRATVDERLSGKIRVGQKATIVLRSHQEQALEGSVARIEAVSDPVTQERIVNIAFVKVPEPFYMNEQAQVHITLRRYEDVIKIPLSVVVTREGKSGVWVAEGRRAHFREIAVLAKDANEAAVENIGIGENILVPSLKKRPLFEGARVRL